MLGQCDIFSESAVTAVSITRNADNAAVFTKINIAMPAVLTLIAENRRIKSHSVADFPVRDICTNFLNNTAGFMTHHNGRLSASGRPIITHHIRAANAARFYTDQHLIRSGCRLLDIGILDFFIFGKNQGFHKRIRKELLIYLCININIIIENNDFV